MARNQVFIEIYSVLILYTGTYYRSLKQDGYFD